MREPRVARNSREETKSTALGRRMGRSIRGRLCGFRDTPLVSVGVCIQIVKFSFAEIRKPEKETRKVMQKTGLCA